MVAEATPDPSEILDAYVETTDPARRHALATLLADLVVRGVVDVRSHTDRIVALRGGEQAFETARLLHRIVNEAAARQAGMQHDMGLGTLAPERRESLIQSLAELDSLHRVSSSTGRSLRDVYELLGAEPEAEGGFGEVFRMRRRADGRVVAVKYLLEEWGRNPQAVARFEREVDVLRRIDDLGGHPNLLPWVDHGRDADRAYLVTEWADAGTMEDLLGRYPGGIPLVPGLALLSEVLVGLGALHGWRLLHRDIKPANLYLKGDRADGGPVWLGDFGVALPMDDERLTQVGRSSPGTPTYAPPEQCLGLAQDARTDLFAWATTAFELLTGAPPDVGDFEPSARALRPEIPAEWDEAIRVCRAERKSGRPAGVAAVQELLTPATP